MKDTYRHKGLRKKLVEELGKKGIWDEEVLKAIEAIPRHYFLDKAFEEVAYQDKAFPIGNEQTISQPYTVAYQTALLEVKKRETVLEIGTGSGYQAAILAWMGARVYTIERQEKLYQDASARLKKLGFEGIRIFMRDGYKGLPEFAPFDKILVTAGAEEIPETLKSQLKVGGLLVIPVGDRHLQTMMRLKRLDEEHFKVEEYGDFRFVPFVKGVRKKKKD